MFERNFRTLALFCLLVNAILGSAQFQSWDQQTRRFRHASCPSCRRERPDALVSWDRPPRRGLYPEFEPEIDPWHVSQPYRPKPNFYPPLRSNPYENPYSDPYNNRYNGALRGRGAPGFVRPEGASRRENLFTIGRDLDFDMAPAQAAPVPSIGGFIPPVQPQTPFSRAPIKTPYGKPSFYDLIRGQSNLVPDNGYTDYSLPVSEPYFDGTKRYPSLYKETNREFRPIFRADRYLDDSIEQSNPMVEPEQRFRGHVAYGTGPASIQTQERNEIVRPRKNRLEHVRLINTPEVKYSRYDPYNSSPDLSLSRAVQKLGKGVMGVANGSRWQNWFEEQRRQQTGGRSVAKSEENGNQVMVVEKTNESSRSGGHFDLSQKLGESIGQRNSQDEGKSCDGSSIGDVSQSQLVSVERTPQSVVLEATTTQQPVIVG
ncbi:unnamed protein product [Xylocopa violacea]|uniref:Uncharacterized protein n=1 Tax=Xylocopa violacea TaxID=135666 RepID=A0ABP1NPE6_XYLVO